MLKYKNQIRKLIAIIILVVPLFLSLRNTLREGIPSYSFVQPRDYYSGILRMRAEGIENLFYTDYDDYLTFIASYIGDRNVNFSSDITTASHPIYGMLDYACPPKDFDNTEVIPSEPDYANIKFCYPHYVYEDSIFVLDNYWKSSKELVAFKTDSGVMFCSNEEYLDLINQKESFRPIDSSIDIFEYMNSILPSEYKMLRQILIIFSIQFIGIMVSSLILKGKYSFFSLAISFPIGSALICMFIILLDFLHVPFSIFSLFILYAALLISPLFFFKKLKEYINIKNLIAYMLLSLLFLLFASSLKMNYSGPDSLAKMLLGRRLATYGGVSDFLESATPFGLYEVAMHGISNIFGVEVFNLLYPYMSFTCVATMLAATYYYAGKQQRKISTIFTGIISFTLLTNSDYFVLSFWILSNGILSAFALILVVSVLFSWKDTTDYSLIILLCSLVILTTRLEGALFICMVMFLTLLLNDNTHLKRIIIVCSSTVIIWNLSLMIKLGYVAENTFWSTSKGIILIIIASGLICISLMYNRIRCFVNDAIWRRRYLVVLVFSALASLALMFIRNTAFSENIHPYLNHLFGKSDLSNSNILWLTVLFSFILFALQLDDLKWFTICIVTIYILLVFDLMLFRTGYPIHQGINDSSRRMLVLIMPFALWSCSLGVGEALAPYNV